jgi:hypothetical protein
MGAKTLKGKPMISWQRDLENARSGGEVLRTTQDFLATFAPDTLACLPEGAFPRHVRDEEDIRDWSRRLTDEYWRQRSLGGELPVTREMWSFFLRASIQLARIDAAHRERVYCGRASQAA